MNSEDAYVEVVRTALTQLSSEDQSVLACMVVLHTCDLLLNTSCYLDDIPIDLSGRKRRLYGVSRRHAANIVANALTKGQRTVDSSVQDYWYARYSSETPYELLKSVPDSFLGNVAAARVAMLSSPLLEDIVETED
jgi:hypothetical protein